ncbi:MAG: hypothetical protein HC862_17230 [Scytonema sp. RU_4_4]|nr:hypothetical protein [Scytonema sp. RU_4_4]
MENDNFLLEVFEDGGFKHRIASYLDQIASIDISNFSNIFAAIAYQFPLRASRFWGSKIGRKN